MSVPPSAVEFLDKQKARLRAKPKRMRVVFPEGDDARVQLAAKRLQQDGLLEPILVGKAGVEPAK